MQKYPKFTDKRWVGCVKKSENFADVIYGSPLRSNQRGENAYKRVQPRTRKLQYSPRNAFQRRQKIEYAAKARRKTRAAEVKGRRLNGFLGLSLNDRTVLFLVILLETTVSVG